MTRCAESGSLQKSSLRVRASSSLISRVLPAYSKTLLERHETLGEPADGGELRVAHARGFCGAQAGPFQICAAA